jgi:hypothetical protein
MTERIEPIMNLHCLWLFFPNMHPFVTFCYRGERFRFVHLVDNCYINEAERKALLN